MPSLKNLVNAVKRENKDDIRDILNQKYTADELHASANDIYTAIKGACSLNTENACEIALQLLQDRQLHDTVLSVIAKNDNEILQLTIENGYKAVTELLLTLEPVSTTAHCENNAILELACKKGDPNIVAALLDIKRIRENAHTNKNFSLLYAAQQGHLAVVKLLLTLPRVKEKAATCKNAALGAAAYGNHQEIVELLLTIKRVSERAAINSNHVLKAALEGKATQALLCLLAVDEVQQELLNEPELFIELCKINDNDVVNAILPTIKQLPFYDFTLNDILIPQARTRILTTTKDVQRFLSDALGFINAIPQEDTFPIIVEAIKIAEVNDRVRRLERTYKTHSETAMSLRALLAANIAYAKAQELYNAEFNQLVKTHGTPQKVFIYMRSLIRDMILKLILKETSDLALQDFIKQNYDQLIEGNNNDLMDRARDLFSSNTNINHIAWRAFDRFAPVVEWHNLFMPPLENTKVFSAGIIEDASEIDLTEASTDIIQRVSFYFIALNDKSIKPLMSHENRETIFIGQIAEIMRAHNEKDISGIDSPSCYPGTIGRIAGMGAGHPELQVVDPIDELSNIIFNMLNHACSIESQASPREQEQLCLALTALNQYTIEMLKDKLKVEFNLTTVNETLTDQQIVTLRKNAIARLGKLDEVFAKINNELQQRDPVVRCLVADEKVYVERQLIDICFNNVGNKVAARLSPKLSHQTQRKLDPSDPFNVKLIEQQFNEISLKLNNQFTRAAGNDAARIRRSLEIAQCQNEIYQFVYSKLLILYKNIDQESLATFAVVIASLQFRQYDTIKDMKEKWQLPCEVLPAVLQKAVIVYRSNPSALWKGPANLDELIDYFKIENLRKSFKRL
jgi:hypothetical protein